MQIENLQWFWLVRPKQEAHLSIESKKAFPFQTTAVDLTYEASITTTSSKHF